MEEEDFQRAVQGLTEEITALHEKTEPVGFTDIAHRGNPGEATVDYFVECLPLIDAYHKRLLQLEVIASSFLVTDSHLQTARVQVKQLQVREGIIRRWLGDDGGGGERNVSPFTPLPEFTPDRFPVIAG